MNWLVKIIGTLKKDRKEMKIMNDVLYTVTEVSELLKINRNSVYSLIRSGVIKGLKLGSIKVTRAELMRFLEDNVGKDLSDLNNIQELKF